MKIEKWESCDYEKYVNQYVDRNNRLTVFEDFRLPGHRPIIFDGSIKNPSLIEDFFPGHYDIPEIRIDILKNATVAGVGAIFTETGQALCGMMPIGGAEHQFEHPAVDLDLQKSGDSYISERLRGERVELDSAILFSRMGFGNYHHLLIDILPRLFVIQQEKSKDFVLHNSDKIPPLLVNHEFSGWILDKLAKCGVDKSNVCHIPHHGHAYVKNLYIPHILNDFARWVSPQTHTFYRNLIKSFHFNSIKTPDKIFLLRRDFPTDRRSISNNVQIADLLISQGFTEVFPERMSWEEEINIFSQAKLIVSAMGSNISNMIFSEPNTKILILQSNESVFSLHSAMGAAGNCRVGYLWGESFSHKSRGEQVEFSIDSRLLHQGLSELILAK